MRVLLLKQFFKIYFWHRWFNLTQFIGNWKKNIVLWLLSQAAVPDWLRLGTKQDWIQLVFGREISWEYQSCRLDWEAEKESQKVVINPSILLLRENIWLSPQSHYESSSSLKKTCSDSAAFIYLAIINYIIFRV